MRCVNLLSDLHDDRFTQKSLHRELEALAARGVVPLCHHRTPENILGWIDAEFGGWWSSEVHAGGAWLADDALGRVAFAAFDARGLRFSWLRPWQQRADVGIFGPFGVIERARGSGIGRRLLAAALFSLRERGYRYALIPVVRGEPLIGFYERHANAHVTETLDIDRPQRYFRTAILASGNGSNFQAVIDSARDAQLPLEPRGLIVNRSNAYAIRRAHAAGIPVSYQVWDRTCVSRAAYDNVLLRTVAEMDPDLVLLLGWMHVLADEFLERFPQLLNVHPAFLPLDPACDSVTMPDGTILPAFRGARAVDDALAAGSGWIGASVHRVGREIDRGDVLARAPLRVQTGESRAQLDARLHAVEHRVLRAALKRWSFEQLEA